MKTSKDPTPDIYAILDAVHLDAGYLLTTRMSTSKMISNMRTEIAAKIVQYIEADRATRPGLVPPVSQDPPKPVPLPAHPVTRGNIELPQPAAESEFPL